MSNEILNLFVNLLLTKIPVLLISAYGLWASLSKRVAFPKPAKLAIWGFSLLIMHSFVSLALQVFVFYLKVEVLSPGEFAAAFVWPSLLSVAAYPLFIAALIMLMRAIYVDRYMTTIQ